MNCPNCGASLPPGARFCYACGKPLAGASAPPPPPPPASAPAAAPAGPAAAAAPVNCPNCGAPLKPLFGEMVITCEYCGASVTLGGSGWKEINKHTLLLPKVTNSAEALAAVQKYLDQGFFHRKQFEESTVVEQKLSFVPFWIIPSAATTTFTYQDVALSVGSTVGSIAAAELLGSALGGGRGRTVVVPMMTGPVVNPTRQDAISGQYEFPVVAVKSMGAYQPKDYKFRLEDRTFFDQKAIPKGSLVLNGDLGEDAAQHAAKAFVMQLQSDLAHKKHYMVSQLTTDVQVSDGELLHVPIWYYLLEHKGTRTAVLIDSHAGSVIQTVA
ncbi:MAG TPA: zinc ribbon domain-containing protein [Thermoplasmata archaeon]|nr:zinc ribbon domain-containing protein [Thermoplasmata archaeon]